MTVAELLNRMSSRELTEWRAWFTIEHLDLHSPEHAANERAAMLAAVIINSAPFRKGRAVRPSEFMPTYADDTQAPTGEELLAKWRAATKRMRGTVENGERVFLAPDGAPRTRRPRARPRTQQPSEKG